MTTTVITTATTDTVDLDGNDIILVTEEGSIIETSTSISVTGDKNSVTVNGTLISTGTAAAISTGGGSDNSITIGRNGYVYNQTPSFGALDLSADLSFATNHGEIHGELAVFLRGDGSTLINTGLISGNNLTGEFSYSAAVIVAGTSMVVNNSGDIISNASVYQDYTGSQNGVNSLINSGNISGDIAVNFDYFTTGSLAISNSGLMTGMSGVAIHVEREMVMVNGGLVVGNVESLANEDSLINSGDIQGDVALGGGIDLLRNTGLITGDVAGEAGRDVLKNDGQILGDVDMGVDADVVINTGTIGGDVFFGDGDDKYLAKGTGSVEDDSAVYGGDGEDKIVGGSFADTFYGEADNDTIFGGGGNDMLFGGAGNDTLKGGADDDEIYGEEGSDTIYGGQGDDLIDGGLNGDTLFGGKGDDDIYGGNGSDELTGGKGDDTLTGGGGSDVFVLSRHDGNDVVTDFADGSDIVDLTVFGLGSKAAVQAGISEIDGGLLFDLSVYGGSGTVLIEDMLLADFTGADFIY